MTCWSDLDGDGFGGEDVGLAPDGNCGAFEDATAAGGDCDDDDPAIHPDAEELCDGIDGDCDGQPLPGEDVDADEDGWLACADCDDQDELIHPDAEEACDGLDSDCDGAIPLDETIDVDGDEIPECGDCDDEDPDAGQLFPEECVGGEDEDCDGLVDELDEDCDGLIDGDTDGWCADGVDLDGDGDCSGEDEAFSDPGELGDCDDEDAAVHPGADELCNGIDDDCDPATGRDEEDLDGDGFAGCDGDCDDGDPAAWPGADEACSDEVDQDCDGSESLDLPDPDCWAAACTDCAGSVPGRAKGGQGPAAALLLLVITLVGRSRRRRTRGTAGPAAAAGLGVVLFGASALAQSPADPDVVRGLVDAGRCDEARTAALPWAAAAPDDPDAWRALGDAERCLGHERAAVLAYRRFLQAGGADPAIETVLQGLADRLGTLEVGLTPGLPRAPVVRIEVGDEVLTPTAEGEAYRFADLPSAVPLAIRVAGLGFAPTEATIEPLAPGEVRRVDSGADWRGLGGLQLSAPLPQGSTAVVLRPGETEQVLSVDEPVPVTAIDVSIRLTTVLGSTEATAPVDDGEVTAFDPGPWLPASLRIVGLPAGASVRVYVESPLGASVTRTVELPGTAGEIDPGTGLRLAPPIVLDSLIGGTGGVFVTHAVLGGEVTSVVIEPGAANAATFEAESLAGAAAVRERWLAWSDHRADLQQRTQRGPLIFGLIAGGSATVAAILVGGASGSGREATGARQLAIQATGTGDLDAIPAAWEAHGDAAVRERGLLTAAGVLTGVAVTSAGLTLTFGLRGQRARAELGAWEPWEAPP